MGEITQYRYWLERLKRLAHPDDPTEAAEIFPEHVENGSAKSANNDPEIAWRVAVMRPQVPARGPIPFLVARETAHSGAHVCLSCGDALAPGRIVRCGLCVAAIEQVLNETREGVEQ
jgi:hypothetical protein